MGDYEICRIDELKKAIEAINKSISPDVEDGRAFDNDVIKGSFWASRKFSTDREGFTLYLAGGDCVSVKQSVKAKSKNIYYAANLDDKKKFFENAKLISTTEKDGKNIDVLDVEHNVFGCTPDKFTTQDWKDLYDVHLNWVKYKMPYLERKGITDYHKNTNYERCFQTSIAYANSNLKDTSEIEIFEMEYKENLDEEYWYDVITSDGGKSVHKSAKPDLLGLRIVDKKAIFYFIEYKCTSSGITGDTSLPEHLADMSHIYERADVLSRVEDIYNNRMKLLGKPVVDFEKYEIESRLLFLFSHINETNPGMTSAAVASSVIDMILSRPELKYDYEQIKDKVEFCVLKDIKNPKIKVESFFKIEETAESLKDCAKGQDNRMDNRKIQRNRLKVLFE